MPDRADELADSTDAPVPEPGKQLNRERRAWYFYDWATSVFSTTVITVFLSPYLTGIAESWAQANGQTCGGDNSCFVYPLGITVNTGSIFAYTLSLATILQVVVLPVVGAIADASQQKRRMLAIFSTVGALCTASLFLVTGTNYLLGVGLFLIANIAYGSSIVVYYSWLPEIAGPDERDKVSSRGWAFGYLGGGLLLALNLVLFLNAEALGISDGDAVRICLASAGIWWLGFSIVTLTGLRQHRKPISAVRTSGALVAGFKQLGHTLRDIRTFPKTLFFLIAYLMYNDGIQTVANVAGEYGREELGIEQSNLITAILMVQFIAFFGALGLGLLARKIGALKTVKLSLVLWIVVLAIAYFIPYGAVLQFFLVAGAIGFVLGGSQALSRSLFSQMIPPGKEAEYFSFYEISERGTSWLGPLLYGLIFQLTGSYRYSVIAMVVFFAIGLLLLSRFDARAAIREAGNTPPAVI